eukprot:10709895-Karenia_brevis.AAC.1
MEDVSDFMEMPPDTRPSAKPPAATVTPPWIHKNSIDAQNNFAPSTLRLGAQQAETPEAPD